MRRYLVGRVGLALPTLAAISLVTFLIIHLIPGDPALVMFGETHDAEGVERLRVQYGLDKPLVVQYVGWLRRMASGDMGRSLRLDVPVWRLIRERIPRTFVLTFAAMMIALAAALPAGIISAYRHNSLVDLTISAGSLASLAAPNFWQGILLIVVFAVVWPIFPIGGYVDPWVSFREFAVRLVLPSLTLGLSLAAVVTRMLRSAMLEVMRQEYTAVARAKGLSVRAVLMKHALRNAAIPTVTIVGLQIGYLLGGSIVVERVFAYPGLGMLLVSSVEARDYPMIQAQILIYGTFFVIVNLLTDTVYALIDPRVRYQ